MGNVTAWLSQAGFLRHIVSRRLPLPFRLLELIGPH